MIENESSWCRFIVVLERRKERLTHWKDNHERGCRNQRRKEVGIPRGKNTYIRAIRASQRYSFKQQSDESKRRTLDSSKILCGKIFDSFSFSSITNFLVVFLAVKRMRGYTVDRKISDRKTWMAIVTIFGVLYANGIVCAHPVYER